jgi:hypothetical protein
VIVTMIHSLLLSWFAEKKAAPPREQDDAVVVKERSEFDDQLLLILVSASTVCVVTFPFGLFNEHRPVIGHISQNFFQFFRTHALPPTGQNPRRPYSVSAASAGFGPICSVSPHCVSKTSWMARVRSGSRQRSPLIVSVAALNRRQAVLPAFRNSE